MTHNYTQNAWEGSRYNSRLSTKDIANLLREYIKKEADLASCKWSITTEYNAIYVSLMSAPFNPFGDLCGLYDKEQGYTQQAQMEGVSSPEAFKVIKKIQSFLLSYNYDDSDGMVDYFDRNFYDHYAIGKWDKPFKVSTKKPASEVKPMEGTAIFESLRNDIEFSAEAGLEMKYTWHINYSIIIRHNYEGYFVSYIEFGKLIDCEYGLSLDDATKALASWIERGYKA